jgi:predicted small lipoprotein YifL
MISKNSSSTGTARLTGALVLASILGLAACGQRGPLYLPESDPPSESAETEDASEEEKNGKP